jgi:hypothetical protein
MLTDSIFDQAREGLQQFVMPDPNQAPLGFWQRPSCYLPQIYQPASGQSTFDSFIYMKLAKPLPCSK